MYLQCLAGHQPQRRVRSRSVAKAGEVAGWRGILHRGHGILIVPCRSSRLQQIATLTQGFKVIHNVTYYVLPRVAAMVITLNLSLSLLLLVCADIRIRKSHAEWCITVSRTLPCTMLTEPAYLQLLVPS